MNSSRSVKKDYLSTCTALVLLYSCLFFTSFAFGDEIIEEQQRAYNAQLSKYNQSKNQLENISTEIRASEAKLQSLETEKEKAAAALEDIQRIDRQNPNLGLSNKVSEARERNQLAYSNYEKEQQHLNQLKFDSIAIDKQVKDEIVALNSIARDIKKAHEQVIGAEVEKRITKFKKSSVVEGRAEVGCADEPPAKCQQRAKKAAERDASEKGSVMIIQAATKIENFQLTQDQIRTEVQAQLSNVEIIEKGWIGDTTYMYHIRAEVTPIIGSSLRNKIQDSIAQELGIVVPEELPYSTTASEKAVSTAATSTQTQKDTKSAAEKSFDELNRETGSTVPQPKPVATINEEQTHTEPVKSVSKPAEKDTTESWYTLWGIGFASNSYEGNLKKIFDAAESENADRITISLEMLGFYWPVNQSTIVGGILSGTSDQLEFPDKSKITLTQSLLALSTLSFLGNPIGKGLFLRGDIGVARASSTIAGDGLTYTATSNTGFGILAGVGYSIPVSDESRILFALNYSIHSIESETYSSAMINVSGLW